MALDVALFFAGCAAVVYPAVLSFGRYGTAAPFKFFATDAFYYLNVARQHQSVGFYSYDGVHPTNGFHPLWQWLLAALFRWFDLSRASDRQLQLDYAVCTGLCAVGVGFLVLAAARATGSRTLALVFTVPGLYDILLSKLVFSTVDGTESAPWSFVNGMESSLSIFWFGIFALLVLGGPTLAQWSLRRLFAASALLTLVIFTRLDDVFLLVSFAVAVTLAARATRPWWKTALATAVVPGLALSAYVFENLRTTGLVLPVSGSMKRDPGALLLNLRDSLQVVFPTRLLTSPQLFTWDATNWRALQLLVPLVVASGFLAYLVLSSEPADAHERRQRNLLAPLAAFVVMKGVYNLVGVQLFAQGHWYFTLSIAITNLLLLFLVTRFVRIPRVSFAPDVRSRVRLACRVLGAAGFVLGLALAFSAYSTSRLLFALLCVTLPSLALGVFSERVAALCERPSGAGFGWLARVLGAVAAVTFVIMSANATVNQKVHTHYGDVNFAFWKMRERIESDLARLAPNARLYEFDDGVMAYALNVPSMSGMGLAIDGEAYAECRQQRCLDVAHRRGFRLISSVAYWGYLNEQRLDFVRPKTEAEILETLVGASSFHVPPGAERFDFSLLHSVDLGKHVLYFLEFQPKPATL